MAKMLKKGLEAGQSPSEMMPMMMMMLMDQQKSKGSRKGKASSSILGGSDSDTSGSDDDFRGKGMAQLHRLQEQIQRRPRKICEQFEREVVEELGVVKGQPWTLRDYVRKQQWGSSRASTGAP